MARKRKIKRIQKQAPTLLWLAVGFVLLIIFISLKDVEIQRQPSIVETEETLTQVQFVETLAPIAQNIRAETGLLPSISLAQAILESDWGQSTLAQEANNLYGVKGTSQDPLYPTQEYYNGQMHTVHQHFATYPSWEASMRAHASLFVNGTSWAPDLYHSVLATDNYKVAAYALQEAGYATDPDYAKKLIHVIESHQLYQYD